ncbi:MAG TPA: FAD:protein FMN transferase [Methylocella sp.]|nr:FAD:protein FMN transferase [Methylocella sp.]
MLGTFVEIAGAGAAVADMAAAVDAAFAAIGTVHRLMSFHDEESDVSRLNHGAFEAATGVHRWTYQVLEAALDIHRRSNGLFDIRIAPALQKLGLLPYHTGDLAHGAALTSGHGEIELLSGDRVRFGDRAMRIDLGGIAKGFAVDRAIDVLRDLGMPSGLVNAGGDLAVFGPRDLMAGVRDPGQPSRVLCRIELRDAAIASSGPQFDPLQSSDAGGPAVIDPASGEPVYAVIGATVRASCCLFADALTKIVMAGGPSAAPLLRQFGAGALFVAADGEVYITPEWRDAAVLAA